MKIKQGIPLLLLIAILLATMAGCAPTPTPPLPTTPAEVPMAEAEGELQRVIEARADGLIFHYLRQSFWGEKEFSDYLANQTRFKADFKEDLEQSLAKNSVSASDYSFSFDSTTRSTVIRCDIHDAITSSSEGRYRARFEWLLHPLGLDFIDNHFQESERGLSWEGSINSVPSTITVELPTIDSSVYKAWEHPIGHCHAHAWWSEGVSK